MDVLLVSMPFGPVFSPSLGLSLLQAGLKNRGVSVQTRYLSIRFAEIIGRCFYEGIARDGRPATRELAGEWIFSGDLFQWSAEDEERYIDEILLNCRAWTQASFAKPASPALIRRIRSARGKTSSYLDWCLEEIRRARPRIVGFTSVFQQHLASLALARRIKTACPETFVVLGGANCEGIMGAETVRQFPFVDATVSGEGDSVFPELAKCVLQGTPVTGLPGVRTRESISADFGENRFSGTAPLRNLDELPYPDFTDYFADFEASRYSAGWQPHLFAETSRGCWWGEKMHCTFCGLNGATMTYRSKSAPRALAELQTLAERHPGCPIRLVDNILDMSYFKTLLPELAARRLDLGLFYETKSNLKKDQIRLLRKAGIHSIQPGIESLSDGVLARMRKGVTGLQNIQLLKWCKELDVTLSWNLLYGFPGEEPAEYEFMARWAPLLTHLPPPDSVCSIRLDRFSPNFFDADKLGLTDVRPLASYRHIYRLPDEALANLAYYFAFDYREPRDVASYVKPLRKQMLAWTRAAASSDLFAVDIGEHLLIWDLRPVSRQPLIVLDRIEKVLYQACDAACDVRHLVQIGATEDLPSPSAEEITDRLDALVEGGLLLRNQSRYLALAIPLGEYSPRADIIARFYRVAASLGRRRGDRLVVPLGLPAATAKRMREASWKGLVGPRGAKRSNRVREPRLTPRHFVVTHAGSLEIQMY